MKKVLSIIMIACFSVVMMMGLTACSSNNNLQKLSAPNGINIFIHNILLFIF